MELYQNLIPYFKVAEQEARKSECTRRQYGAVIVPLITKADTTDQLWFVANHNTRVTSCCNGNTCQRTAMGLHNGERTEVGAELHAEIAALVSLKREARGYFILVGFQGNRPLYDFSVWPCHSCALAIKFAGYKYVHMYKEEGTIEQVSIEMILARRQLEWTPV